MRTTAPQGRDARASAWARSRRAVLRALARTRPAGSGFVVWIRASHLRRRRAPRARDEAAVVCDARSSRRMWSRATPGNHTSTCTADRPVVHVEAREPKRTPAQEEFWVRAATRTNRGKKPSNGRRRRRTRRLRSRQCSTRSSNTKQRTSNGSATCSSPRRFPCSKRRSGSPTRAEKSCASKTFYTSLMVTRSRRSRIRRRFGERSARARHERERRLRARCRDARHRARRRAARSAREHGMPERAEARAEIVPMPGPVAATVAARDAYARSDARALPGGHSDIRVRSGPHALSLW